MKSILFLATIALCSCSTPEQNAKLAAITNLALTYAETQGKISPADAALVREAGKVVLAPDAPVTLPVVEVSK